MELGPKAGAGQGMGFRGEVDGNLENRGSWSSHSASMFKHFSIYFYINLKSESLNYLLTCTTCYCPPDPLFPSDPSHLQ